MKNLKILDCTLRDGGYYTNWQYDLNLVNDYLSCMSDLKIDFVTITGTSIPEGAQSDND